MINMAYCCLILLGKVIQKLVFGKLRVIENQVRFKALFTPYSHRYCIMVYSHCPTPDSYTDAYTDSCTEKVTMDVNGVVLGLVLNGYRTNPVSV